MHNPRGISDVTVRGAVFSDPTKYVTEGTVERPGLVPPGEKT